MPDIIVHDRGKLTLLKSEAGQSLFILLRDNGHPVYSPCGGKGTCGKCLVHIKGSGDVTSCLYKISNSVEVILPDQKAARILTSQHYLTRELPFEPGPLVHLCDHPYGIAVDIGTTTLVFYLVDLVTGILTETRSMLNPQSVYGHDIITRIMHASTQGGREKLQGLIMDAINFQSGILLRHQEVSAENLVRVVVAGNNTMLHLLLGIDPSSMGQAPYAPGFVDSQVRSGRDLGLDCHPGAEILLLPSVSAFVGSDIVAGLGSIREDENYARYIFVDLGTNGELALVTPDSVWCCATAAGPVFEGANISCGVGGVEGAIDGFSDGIYSVIGDEKPMGVCGSGLVDLIASFLDRGIMDNSGFLNGKAEIVRAEESATGRPIYITQEDIRQVQLAKSAIASGINLLLKRSGLQYDEINALFMAGGFGNYLNPDNAMKIGLLPPQLKGKVISLGNTAGTGAILGLKSVSFLQILDSVLQKSRHIELSADEDFPLEFAMNMNF